MATALGGRFATREGPYFRMVQPYEHHTDMPEPGIYAVVLRRDELPSEEDRRMTERRSACGCCEGLDALLQLLTDGDGGVTRASFVRRTIRSMLRRGLWRANGADALAPHQTLVDKATLCRAVVGMALALLARDHSGAVCSTSDASYRDDVLRVTELVRAFLTWRRNGGDAVAVGSSSYANVMTFVCDVLGVPRECDDTEHGTALPYVVLTYVEANPWRIMEHGCAIRCGWLYSDVKACQDAELVAAVAQATETALKARRSDAK